MKRILPALALVFIIVWSGCTGGSDDQYEIRDFDAFFERLIALKHAEAMFIWDMETGLTPPGAIEARANTIAVISAEIFAMSTSDEMQRFFRTVEAGQRRGEIDEISLGIYRIAKRDYDMLMAIPADEYRAFSELTTISFSKWLDAREADDFSIFAPYLQELIDYQRKFIEYRRQAGIVYANPYDAMLDDFEPGMTVEIMDPFFDELRAAIVPLLRDIMAEVDREGGKNIRTDFLERRIPLPIQRNLSQLIMYTVGFDPGRGVIGESEHPFSIGFGQSDVRITTNYDEDNFIASFYTVMHECGHAIYDQNVARELEGTILDTGTSMSIHESQSRFLENMIGRSYEFWQGIYDDFMRVTEGYFYDVSMRELYEAMNTVTPSLIRVDADELTYSLHIMVRYEIEKMIFNNPNLNAEDLPGLWNEKMQEYLGVRPENYAEGILQDVHWSYGEFGYFPTYALGNAYAAQIWNAMEKDFDLSAAVRALDFETINTWLTEKIHRHGSLLDSQQILAQITDEGFTSRYYIDYLTQKYAALYGIQ